MLISNHTPQELEERNVINRVLLMMATALYIRNSFIKAPQTMEAESWIAIAREQGFIKLADELQNDLETELIIKRLTSNEY